MSSEGGPRKTHGPSRRGARIPAQACYLNEAAVAGARNPSYPIGGHGSSPRGQRPTAMSALAGELSRAAGGRPSSWTYAARLAQAPHPLYHRADARLAALVG